MPARKWFLRRVRVCSINLNRKDVKRLLPRAVTSARTRERLRARARRDEDRERVRARAKRAAVESSCYVAPHAIAKLEQSSE